MTRADAETSPVVGIFGKHPAWPDHISIPLNSAGLGEFRNLIYNTGIRTAIERGLWHPETAKAFDHTILTGMGRSWTIARIWESSDKIGRREYPMVAAMHFADGDLLDAIILGNPIVESLASACRAATEESSIVAALTAAKNITATDWKARFQTTAFSPPLPPLALSDDPPIQSLRSAWAGLISPSLLSRLTMQPRPLGTHAVRIPCDHADFEQGLTYWSSVAKTLSKDRWPIFLSISHERKQIDIILGQAGAEEFVMLRR